MDVSMEFQNLKELNTELDEATKEINSQIEALVAKKDEISKPYLDKITECRQKIINETMNLKESIKTDYGRAIYRKGYTRYSWDNKKLEGYAAIHEEILKFRKESQIEPTVMIKME